MQLLAKKMTAQLIKGNVISPQMMPIYQYGFELLFSTLFTSVSILMIACLTDSLYLGLWYFLITIPLRMSCGGYHADTYCKCFIISNLLYIMLSCTNKLLSLFDVPAILWILLLLIGCSYILYHAPVKNIHHPIGEKALNRNKKICFALLTVDCSLLIPLLILNPQSHMVRFAVLSILSVAILILPTQYQRKEG